MSLYLGIDIGTTTVATVIIEKPNLSVRSVFMSPHNAYIKNENGIAEQNVNAILTIVDQLIKKHPIDLIKKVKGIGIAGQMHGILLWNKSTKKHSNLITWQDERASVQKILEKFQNIENCSGLRDGFGLTSLASIFYNQKNNMNDDLFNLDINHYDCCGTIMDYLVWIYIGSPNQSFIDYTNAASWGLYDISTNQWDFKAIKNLGIDINILPTIVKTGSKVGELCHEYATKYQINSPIPVKCAIGDNQSTIIATSKNYDDEIYITFGTGTQLSIVVNKDVTNIVEKSPKYELRPFPYDKLLVVTAPLSGGKSWELLKDMTKDLFKKFDINFTDLQIYDKLDEMAIKELNSADLPQVHPHFQGERWDPSLSCTINNINLYNFSIGKIAAGLLIGLANNIKGNIPLKYFENRHIIIGNGTFFKKSKALQKAIEKVFKLPIKFTNTTEESAMGAAILSMD